MRRLRNVVMCLLAGAVVSFAGVPVWGQAGDAAELDARWSEGARAVLTSAPATLPTAAYHELRETWLAVSQAAMKNVVGEVASLRGTVLVNKEGEAPVLVFTAAAVSRERVALPEFEAERGRSLPRYELTMEIYHRAASTLERAHPELSAGAELAEVCKRGEVGGHTALLCNRPDGQVATRVWVAGDRMLKVEVRGEKCAEEADAMARSLHEAATSRGVYSFPSALTIDPVVRAAPPAPPPASASSRPGAGDATDVLKWARIETSMGNIVLALNETKAPISVENFVAYVKNGFYENTTFHRVIKDFMIQGGGHDADFRLKSNTLPPIANEWRNGIKNNRGTIAMARLGGNADSATSQFFINVEDHGKLDRPQSDGAGYAVFGSVVDGMDTVDKIRFVQTAPRGNARDVPLETVLIHKVVMLEGADVKPEWRADYVAPPAREGSPE